MENSNKVPNIDTSLEADITKMSGGISPQFAWSETIDQNAAFDMHANIPEMKLDLIDPDFDIPDIDMDYEDLGTPDIKPCLQTLNKNISDIWGFNVPKTSVAQESLESLGCHTPSKKPVVTSQELKTLAEGMKKLASEEHATFTSEAKENSLSLAQPKKQIPNTPVNNDGASTSVNRAVAAPPQGQGQAKVTTAPAKIDETVLLNVKAQTKNGIDVAYKLVEQNYSNTYLLVWVPTDHLPQDDKNNNNNNNFTQMLHPQLLRPVSPTLQVQAAPSTEAADTRSQILRLPYAVPSTSQAASTKTPAKASSKSTPKPKERSPPVKSLKSGHRCPFCSKSFQQFSQMKRHRKIHEGDGKAKLNLCPLCGIPYNCLATMHKHLRQVHYRKDDDESDE